MDEQLKIAANLPTCAERDRCVLLILDEMHLREDLSFDKHTGTNNKIRRHSTYIIII